MKLWKGRFSKAATSSADEFNASIEFDQRLYKEDITGSIAHATMLAKQGIIPQEDADLIIKTLQEILADIEAGKVEFTIESEDIHMNIESILTERIGDAGKKLHTARSRNDQIAVDIRLYLKKEIAETDHIIGQLLDALAKLAKEHTDTVMPVVANRKETDSFPVRRKAIERGISVMTCMDTAWAFLKAIRLKQADTKLDYKALD